MRNKVGDIVTMSEEALENYGEKWRDVELEITARSTRYMPATEFFAQGQPEGFHPGYDETSGDPLFDLKIVKTGKMLNFSLYQWEVH